MALPVSLAAYADLEPILDVLIASGGLRIPRGSLPPTPGPKVKARAEHFRFRFYNYRKLLAQHGDPRAEAAFSFTFDIDCLGDLTIRPVPRPAEGITDLEGNPVRLSAASAAPSASAVPTVSEEAESFSRFLLDESDA